MAKVIQLETLPELRLLEDITRESAARLIEDLAQYKGIPVALSIFSDGGDAHGAFAVAEYIGTPANNMQVEARVFGNAASGAMIIAAAAQKAYIAPGAFALVHNAFVAGGEADKDQQAVLDAMNERQRELFSKRTGKTKASVEKLMEQDKPISAEDAVDFGFFDGLIPQTARIAAYKQIPEKVEIKTRKVAVGHAKLLAAALTADGSLELPEESFTVTSAEEVKTLKADIEAKQKELDELKAKVDGIEAIEKAKTEAEAQVVALTKERDTFKASDEAKAARIEAIEKNPIVAKIMAEGTEKVVPGASDATPTVQLTERERHFVSTQKSLEDYLKRKQEQK